jgi:hypothetical protein
MVAKKEPLRMPRMDGIAAAREIRGKYLRVKVIGLSSMRTDISQTRWKKLGPWGLPKVEARGGRNSTYTRTACLPSLSAFDSNNPTRTASAHGPRRFPSQAEIVGWFLKSAESGGPCRGRTYGPLIKSSDQPQPEPTQQDLTQQNIEDPEKLSS